VKPAAVLMRHFNLAHNRELLQVTSEECEELERWAQSLVLSIIVTARCPCTLHSTGRPARCKVKRLSGAPASNSSPFSPRW
jgi:hypothetical protein